jgi:putative ABC transport system permease protein
LGLFGLATYSAEQRIKEIGVRKVLAATVFRLASLLSKDFLGLVFIANVIAFQIARGGRRNGCRNMRIISK